MAKNIEKFFLVKNQENGGEDDYIKYTQEEMEQSLQDNNFCDGEEVIEVEEIKRYEVQERKQTLKPIK